MHGATAMRHLTNQNAGEDADGWLAWWAKNKSKTQAEWIVEGFAQRGLKIDAPPTTDQIPTLLTLLGNADTDEQAIPAEVKYNSFRFLRDSGFDPVRFALSNRPVSADIERGLLEYGKWLDRWPKTPDTPPLVDQLGDGLPRPPVPAILTPGIQAGGYASVFVPLALGAVLLLWSFRRKAKDR